MVASSGHGIAMPRLRSIDLLRVFGVVLMVGFHTQATFAERDAGVPLGDLFASGYRGADLFFVISGFVIVTAYGPDIGRAEHLKRYLARRVVRIYPALWIASASALLVYLIGFGGRAKLVKLEPGALADSLLALSQNGFALVNTSWTLTYEVFFYALFGLAIADRRFGVCALVGWQGASLLFAVPFLHLVPASWYVRSFSLEIGIGMIGALVDRRLGTPQAGATQTGATQTGATQTGAPWAVVAVLGLASFLLGMRMDDQSVPAGMLAGLGGGALVLGSVRLERAGWRPGPAPLVRLGQASYSVYLIHFSVVALFVSAAARLRLPVTDGLALACAGSAIAAGVVFDRVVDRPIRRLLLSAPGSVRTLARKTGARRGIRTSTPSGRGS